MKFNLIQGNSELKPIMFVGTGSDVGKSVINAAFCRIFRQDGLSPAPFKAQNMSLNSYATKDGLEIGRAQAVQAEACKIDCSSDMNPVLLKPTSDQSAQVILNGKPIGNQTAKEYFQKTDRNHLFQQAFEAFKRLSIKYNPIVLEGAGSISEMNLWSRDITNMRMALKAGAVVILIADIDKGGIFGSLYGTLKLLPKAERKLIRGILINKFRGDRALFEDGKLLLEKITGIPVIGIIPWFRDIRIDQEDAVILDQKNKPIRKGLISIAVVLVPHMSNFTDFNALERLEDVRFFYAATPSDLQDADVIILPGSKNTIEDMLALRKSGMAKEIILAHQKGKCIYGICGGYQMMGMSIQDPYHVESTLEIVPGLQILPVTTILGETKLTEQKTFYYRSDNRICHGYEIHMGKTLAESPSPLCRNTDGFSDGFFKNEKVWGTYLHGIFDNEAVIEDIFKHQQIKLKHTPLNNESYKDQQYDKLADLVRENCSIDKVYSWMQEP